jgi:hypothetical protein
MVISPASSRQTAVATRASRGLREMGAVESSFRKCSLEPLHDILTILSEWFKS